jgi:hypothetical protein
VTSTIDNGQLRLTWNRHLSGVVYYQVIRNSGSPTQTSPEPTNLAPFRQPIPAVYQSYNVSLPVPASPNKPVYYRVRACNTAPLSLGAPLLSGFTGCRDSKEFIAGFIAGANQTGNKTSFCAGLGFNGYPVPPNYGCPP